MLSAQTSAQMDSRLAIHRKISHMPPLLDPVNPGSVENKFGIDCAGSTSWPGWLATVGGTRGQSVKAWVNLVARLTTGERRKILDQDYGQMYESWTHSRFLTPFNLQ